MAEPPKDDEAKFNETLKRLLKMPPKPHKDSKIDDSKRRQGLTKEANQGNDGPVKKGPRRSGAK